MRQMQTVIGRDGPNRLGVIAGRFLTASFRTTASSSGRTRASQPKPPTPPSRPRDFHSAAPPSTFGRCFKREKTGRQNDSLADGIPSPSLLKRPLDGEGGLQQNGGLAGGGWPSPSPIAVAAAAGSRSWPRQTTSTVPSTRAAAS